MTLSSGSHDDVREMFRRMSEDKRRMMTNIIQLVYFMRGAIQYGEMYEMTRVEREAVSEFIEKRLEMEAKKTNPIY
jgi:hypothetical protein